MRDPDAVKAHIAKRMKVVPPHLRKHWEDVMSRGPEDGFVFQMTHEFASIVRKENRYAFEKAVTAIDNCLHKNTIDALYIFVEDKKLSDFYKTITVLFSIFDDPSEDMPALQLKMIKALHASIFPDAGGKAVGHEGTLQ
jgi:hypothetical protein